MIKHLAHYYKVIVHALVWTVLFTLQINYFSTITGTSIAMQRGILLLIIFIAIFYTNWFILVPKFYIKKQYLLFILLSISLLLIASIVRIAIEKYYNVFQGLVRPRAYFNKPIREVVLSFGASSFFFITSFFLKILDYYTIQSRQKDQLLQQKTEAEIKLLKAQLNPHFLFNALNNIYALVLTRSENAAESLMSLSQLLRYIIYDAEAEKVDLSKEISFLNYYIELESLRLLDKKRLKANISVEPSNFKIMTMLFIPFVENSFKHSNINTQGHIKIEINLTGNELNFNCENTFSDSGKCVDQVGGIGLNNSKKRMEMIYPQQHNLTISKMENVFRVQLKIYL